MKKIIWAAVLYSCVVFAQNKESLVSFRKDVMPTFTKKCIGCHAAEDEGLGNLFLTGYSELMKGDSDHGPVVVKGKSDKSVLIMKLRGTAGFGKRMPRGMKPLDEKTIGIISRWIDQGAPNN
ncbi:MAG: c-type cytochrome domain-containing protein [Bacteroidota bacterium]|jgi:hypothetical protein